MCNRRQRAFTLIELLVVISIISALMSILLPILSHARQSAISVQCASQLRQLHLGLMVYAEDYNGWGPEVMWSSNMYLPNASNYGTAYWSNPDELFVCPDTDPSAIRAGTSNLHTSYPVMFGVGNHINPDYWFGLNSTTNPIPWTPNVNMMGRNVTNGNATRYIPHPWELPSVQDAGGRNDDRRTWNERAGTENVPNNHWRLGVKNTIHMDGHVKTHRYDELDIIMIHYQRHVGVPTGWLDRVAP